MVSALKLQPPIDPKMKLSKVGGGGVVTNWDLALILMTYPPFARATDWSFKKAAK